MKCVYCTEEIPKGMCIRHHAPSGQSFHMRCWSKYWDTPDRTNVKPVHCGYCDKPLKDGDVHYHERDSLALHSECKNKYRAHRAALKLARTYPYIPLDVAVRVVNMCDYESEKLAYLEEPWVVIYHEQGCEPDVDIRTADTKEKLELVLADLYTNAYKDHDDILAVYHNKQPMGICWTTKVELIPEEPKLRTVVLEHSKGETK